MRTVIIVAMNQKRLIGKAGGLPWHVPADLKHFKQTTMGHALIMGRKTYDSCGKPLPGRRNIVITRTPDSFTSQTTDTKGTSLDYVDSLDAAIEVCRSRGEEIAFIAGGSQIYAQAIPVVDEMIITHLDFPDAEGDAYFPEFNEAKWEKSPYPADPSLKVIRYTRASTD